MISPLVALLLLVSVASSTANLHLPPAFAQVQSAPPFSTNSATGTGYNLAQLFNSSQNSVVQVSSRDVGSQDPFESSLGSGFVYDQFGHIVTNYHVISGQIGTVHITFSDGSVYNAKIVGSDPYSDISVLLAQNITGLKLSSLHLANSSSLVVGEPVAAIGNPYGLSGSMSQGIVSGLHRLIPAQTGSLNESGSAGFSIPDIIQTDAAINPGNSGGPLLDLQGNVIGMNTAIYSTSGAFQGVGFALPSNTISKVVPVLLANQTYPHPWLGISGTNMTPELAEALGLKQPRGFLVTGTIPGSPAAAAGMQGSQLTPGAGNNSVGGDIILGIDGVKVGKIDDLLSYLEAKKKVGDTVDLTILRNGEQISVPLTLGVRPAAGGPIS